ncbi:uncharacterized protein TNCV_3112461 [Trichonephila clavipes]|nr:uncharacterized protein TNCV_3112461 [Trichonephila clavipes]
MTFGQEDVLIQVYVRELLKLVLQNTEIKKVNLSSLYDKIKVQLCTLESLGVTKEKYAAMLFPLVESCLPTEILHAWVRYVGYLDESVIEKAFLQIGVREQDRDFFRFMWYDRENRDHIKIYHYCHVVFGVTSSPFIMGATLNQHLENARGNIDNVDKILRKSFYDDNCVTSFETEEQLQKFIVGSKKLLSSGHFNLRGWQSNILLNPEKFSELDSQPDNFETMVLGLIWNLKDDYLSCNTNCQKNERDDLASPLHLKDKPKGWVVLFTCAVFPAVYFELITSLSTAAFLQSLRRFISRRGRSTIIYSDNGTNFVGSNSALSSIDWDVVTSKANIQKIKWKFNPPSAAWWGGFGERMVQMLRIMLAVGDVVVVENCLKNRTLWSLARVIQLIPRKDGHVRVAHVKTETGKLVRPVQRLYNLELQEPEINLPKEQTDSVICTRRDRKVTSPKRLTYA